MGNIRLFFSNSITTGMTDMLDKSQSHYLQKVMRIKENEIFSLFNNKGEWEAKILKISKGLVEFEIIEKFVETYNNRIGRYVVLVPLVGFSMSLVSVVIDRKSFCDQDQPYTDYTAHAGSLIHRD